MRILFVIRDMFTGGAGKQLALTASSLVERGHKVFLYTYIGSTMGKCPNYGPAELG